MCIQLSWLCGETVDNFGFHGLSCRKTASKFNGHSEIKFFVKKTLASAGVTSCLEQKGLVRSDWKRPDGMTWSRGKALVRDVTVVGLLSRGRAGSLHLAVEEAEKKQATDREISDSGFIFQPVTFDTQGNYARETSILLNELLKSVIFTTYETLTATTQLHLHPKNVK